MSETLSWTAKIEQTTQASKETSQRFTLHAGDLCPWCHHAQLDYDGLLNLSCHQCGYIANSGGFS